MTKINKKGSILLSVCYAAIIVSIIGIIVASATLVTIQGVKLSQLHLEATLYGNNVIERVKVYGVEEYLVEPINIEGFTTNNGENVEVDVVVSKEENMYIIEVFLRHMWGDKEKETKVEGYQYAGR